MDRLGSTNGKFYPYGEDKAGNPGNDAWKFATYFRDTVTGLDYADQRYYSNSLGRFTSADRYRASGGQVDPKSWNRYAYVNGDPITFYDPTGRDACTEEITFVPQDCGSNGGGGGSDDPASLFLNSWINLGNPGPPPGPASIGLSLVALLRVLADASKASNNAKVAAGSTAFYPTGVQLVADSCTLGGMAGEPTAMTADAVRRITYRVLDQLGNPWSPADGSLTVNEFVTGSGRILGRGVWATNTNDLGAKIDSNGRFIDLLTLNTPANSRQPPANSVQSFYGSGNFLPQPLWIMIGGATSYLNNLYFSQSTVTVNNLASPGGCR